MRMQLNKTKRNKKIHKISSQFKVILTNKESNK